MEFWMNVSVGVPYLLQRKMIEDGLLRGEFNVDVGYIDSDFSIQLMYPRGVRIATKIGQINC